MSVPPLNVLIVAPGIPHPTEGGSSVVFYEYIKAVKKAGFNVLNLLLMQPDNSSDSALAAYRAGLEEPGRFEILCCRSPQFVTTRHGQHRLDTAALSTVRNRILAFKPAAVLALDILGAWAVVDLPIGNKVVWLGDLNFESHWYVTLYARREGNLAFKHIIYSAVSSIFWGLIYRKVLKSFDTVIACAKSSERALARIGINACYFPYPWPRLSLKPRDDQVRASIPSLLFFGGLAGLGSKSAFHLLIEEIYPMLRREFGEGGFRVVICGRGELPAWASRQIEARKEIDFRGYVSDLDTVMDECHALLAPIDVPVGNRTRILTAISRRLPVIAHRNTALGNPALVDGETCYLARTAGEFVDRIRRVVRNHEEAKRIVKSAYRSYIENFGPDHATIPIIAAIERVRVAS